MGKVIFQDSVVGGEQQIFVNNRPVSNAQNFSASYKIPSINSSFLGENTSFSLPDGRVEGQVSITSLLLEQDYMLPLTGNLGINGFLLNNKSDKMLDSFSFVSGYLTSYSHSYSIDSPPTVSVDFQVFKSIGPISESSDQIIINELNLLSYTSTGIFNEVSIGCALVDLTGLDNCPLTSYSINASTPRIPIYPINKRSPSHVFLDDSANLTVSLSFERSDYGLFNNSNYPLSKPIEDISISLYNKSGQPYNEYLFTDMILDSTSLNSTPTNPNIISLVYRKKIA